MAVICADKYTWTDLLGQTRKGFGMDGYLKENLDQIPGYLKKDFDCVGIISGSGQVRVGKSSLALQIGAYLSYILKNDFTLEENVVFNPVDLKDRAMKLPKNSVIVYDEGRGGLDAKRSMEAINKGMQDFFQEIGFKNLIILIVLPDFFQLSEIYATSRSLFLVDVVLGRKQSRGYFKFYSKDRKERLYLFGKKLLGSRARYHATNPDFLGRFPSFLPFDKKEYEMAKRDALRKKNLDRINQKTIMQSRILLFYMSTVLGIKYDSMVDDIYTMISKIPDSHKLDIEFNNNSVSESIRFINKMNKQIYRDAKEETDNTKKIDEYKKMVKERDEKLLELRKNFKEVNSDKRYWLEYIFGEEGAAVPDEELFPFNELQTDIITMLTHVDNLMKLCKEHLRQVYYCMIFVKPHLIREFKVEENRLRRSKKLKYIELAEKRMTKGTINNILDRLLNLKVDKRLVSPEIYLIIRHFVRQKIELNTVRKPYMYK